MKLEITAASNVGCVRRQNEDMVLVGSHIMRDDEYSTQVNLEVVDRYLIAVADGMGGHNRGDVASSDVLHNLQFFYHDMPVGLSAGDFNETMVGWLDFINNYVASKGRADEQFKGMGTTLVGLAYYGSDFFTMNCGDSRLYCFKNGVLTQLTTDHSLSNMMGREKHSSIITNCIGGGCNSSYIDIKRITDELEVGDCYLLCSDGLSDMLSDPAIQTLLANGADAVSLCDAAVAAGGFDNVSCCVITVKEEGGKSCL